MKKTDLTQHEIVGLRHAYNFTDGHCHQKQTPAQAAIIEQLSALWYQAESMKQHEIDSLFVQQFFYHQGQYTAPQLPYHLLYSSSLSIAITALYLMQGQLSVSLISPCFDNLPDLLRHHQIPLFPLAEGLLHDPTTIYDNLCKHVQGDALFLVDINNPTGFSLLNLGPHAYQEIIRYCKEYKKILLIDFCFAPFMMCGWVFHDKPFDVYALLRDSGIDFIAYEDTGKVRPTQDAKASILLSSQSLAVDLYNIKSAYTLNISPFILRVLTEYIRESEHSQYYSQKTLIQSHTAIVKQALEGTMLEYVESPNPIPLARCRITDPTWTGERLQEYCVANANIHILPGSYFFRDNPRQGDGFVRIALSRDTDLLRQGMQQLRTALLALSS